MAQQRSESRLDHWDSDDEVPEGLWNQRLRTSLKGRRGQAILAELEEALLALPNKRLISGHLATEDGEVCLVGALKLRRDVKAGRTVADSLEDLLIDDDLYRGIFGTAEVGKSLGMSWTLAWHLGTVNDEEFGRNITPERRYELVLAWVRKHRATPGAGIA